MTGQKELGDQPATYQIRVRGRIGERWASWFDEMTLTHTSEGDTLLTGVVPDQAALYGILNKLRNLNLDLISVCPENAVSPVETNSQDGSQTNSGRGACAGTCRPNQS